MLEGCSSSPETPWPLTNITSHKQADDDIARDAGGM
jgi:hypothetical protein